MIGQPTEVEKSKGGDKDLSRELTNDLGESFNSDRPRTEKRSGISRVVVRTYWRCILNWILANMEDYHSTELMRMPIKIYSGVIKRLQDKYHYLVNYESSDPGVPINPLTYVDSGGDNLVHIAAQLGDLETVSFLIGAGLDVNETGDMGFTALHYAYDGKHQDIVDFLLNHGASSELINQFGEFPGE